jgi:hypothetical protein
MEVRNRAGVEWSNVGERLGSFMESGAKAQRRRPAADALFDFECEEPLRQEIDEELIEAYHGTVSLPIAAGDHQRIAAKIVDDRSIESLKVMEVKQ